MNSECPQCPIGISKALKSKTNTPEMKRRILGAVCVLLLPSISTDAVFKNGNWWIISTDGRKWLVTDSTQFYSNDGLSLEFDDPHTKWGTYNGERHSIYVP